jgi:hypothetical protein
MMWEKLVRRAARGAYRLRRAIGAQRRRKGPSAAARIGIYVPYYDASRYYATHLESFRRNTAGAFNYYVMKNCSSAEEARAFDRVVGEYGFPEVFEPWPRLDPLPHGESLQRMIDATDEEVIVVCDVDAFPVARGWDEFVLGELEHKDIVAVVAHFPRRERLPVFLHPCFMAFRRRFMTDNGLDMRPGEGTDPGYRFTQYLMRHARFDEDHVTGLFPTRREVAMPDVASPAQCFGRTDLAHGFGTTYSDLVFHFWFARNIRTLQPVYDDDGRLALSREQMAAVVERVNARYGAAG